MYLILYFCRSGEVALCNLAQNGTSHKEADFLAARNLIMLQLLLDNGQRTGAIMNVTVGDYNNAMANNEGIVIQVPKHKTSSKFVCSLVVSAVLATKLASWFTARCSFFTQRLGTAKDAPSDPLFCGCPGKSLPSNELARLCRIAFGGTVNQMRKAQYHLVSFFLHLASYHFD